MKAWLSVRFFSLIGSLHFRTDLEKFTHQCDETQGNSSTQALSTKVVFFGCKKKDRQQKRKETKRGDKK